MFDFTITLGHILTVAGFSGVGMGVIVAVRQDVKILSARLEPLEKAIVNLTDILVKLGGHEERIKSVERELQRDYPREKRR